MKRLLVLLLCTSALTAFAGTCATSTSQRGPGGPWVGEVTNTGTDVVSDSMIRGDVTDATGRTVSIVAPTCPTRLAPGEVATWEVLAEGYGLVPPLTGVFRTESTAADLGATGNGLTVSLIETNAAQRAVLVSIMNRSRDTIGGLSVCASMYLPGGELVEVGSARVVPSQLSPGESVTAVIPFASLPPGAAFNFKPQGIRLCCGELALDADAYETTSVLVGNGAPGRRAALITGEVTNNSGRDLIEMTFSAHIEGNAFARIEYLQPGCVGAIPDGERGPVSFILEVPAGVAEDEIEVVVNGIQGRPSEYPLVSLPARDVVIDAANNSSVSAEIFNATNSWVRAQGTCFNVRARDGRLLGSATNSTGSLLGPGQSFRNAASVDTSAPGSTLEVVTYAQRLPAEPTPIRVP